MMTTHLPTSQKQPGLESSLNPRWVHELQVIERLHGKKRKDFPTMGGEKFLTESGVVMITKDQVSDFDYIKLKSFCINTIQAS